MKEEFAKHYIDNNKIKWKAITKTYEELDIKKETRYAMYKKANELLEDEEVIAIIDMYIEDKKANEVQELKNEIIKTNNKLWETYEQASIIENKLTKNGDIIDGFFKFQDSNVVVATLQILARQSDEIRKEIEKLSGDDNNKTSDIITIEWR